MEKIAIYILMEYIIPIPIAVEGLYPIVINPDLEVQDERTYINLYKHIDISLKDDNCNRFNGMYYLCQSGDLPAWIGICSQNKYFCFEDEVVKNDGSKRGVNFADIISPVGTEGKLKSCSIICEAPVVVDNSIISVASKNRIKLNTLLKIHKVICEVKPFYETAFVEFINRNNYIKSDVFVISRDEFIEYVNVTALIINRLKQERDFYINSNITFDNVAEILLNIFVIYKEMDVMIFPVMNFKFTELIHS